MATCPAKVNPTTAVENDLQISQGFDRMSSWLDVTFTIVCVGVMNACELCAQTTNVATANVKDFMLRRNRLGFRIYEFNQEVGVVLYDAADGNVFIFCINWFELPC